MVNGGALTGAVAKDAMLLGAKRGAMAPVGAGGRLG